MIVDALVEQIFARVADVSATFPSARGPLYRRIGLRQRELVALANQANPEYYGASVIVPIVNGRLQITTIQASNVLAGAGYGYGYGHNYGGQGSGFTAIDPDLIQIVVISDPGTSPYPAGREVTIVVARDSDSELPPRATLRQGLLQQIGTDLVGVNALQLYYSVRPAPIGVGGGQTVLFFDEPWVGLLEIDGAKSVVQRSFKMDTQVKVAILAALDAEEKELLAKYLTHVSEFTVITQRFLPPLKAAPAGT